MERVADLLTSWSRELGLDEEAQLRWRAIGFLHDALREASPEELRGCVPPALRDLPGLVLHGPAAAERLRSAGVTDAEVLDAVAYHTIGAPSLGQLGRALYAADFLEPGRPFLPEWRASLRARMPWELDAVTREVLGARIRHLVEKGSELLPQTIAFWNVMASEGR
jgi:2-amino-4-hydroxy-6-hydroxymethyldihydropteridine diphosphokinase